MFQTPFLGFVTLDAAVNIMTGFILKNHRWGDAVFRVSWQILSQTTMREKD